MRVKPSPQSQSTSPSQQQQQQQQQQVLLDSAVPSPSSAARPALMSPSQSSSSLLSSSPSSNSLAALFSAHLHHHHHQQNQPQLQNLQASLSSSLPSAHSYAPPGSPALVPLSSSLPRSSGMRASSTSLASLSSATVPLSSSPTPSLSSYQRPIPTSLPASPKSPTRSSTKLTSSPLLSPSSPTSLPSPMRSPPIGPASTAPSPPMSPSSPPRSMGFSSLSSGGGGLLSLKGWGSSKQQRFVSLRSRSDAGGLASSTPVQSAAPAISLPPAAEPVAAIVPTAAADFGQPTAPTELAELESLSTLTKDSIPATSGLTPTVAIVPPSFDPLFEHTASPLHSILEPVPTSFLESSAADLAAASDDGDTGSSDSEDDSDVDELFSFLSSKTSSPSVSADSITVAPSFADSEEATASVFSVARNGAGRLWSKSSSSSSAISSTSTANDAAAAGPSSSPLRRSTSSSTVKESAEAAQSTELKTTTSTASLTAPASPVDRFPRARDSNSSPPPTRLKPILRRESCPENLDLLGQTGEEYRHGLTRNASQPHLHRSDSAKSLSFREKLEQICLFSSGDSPSQLALVPQTEFFVGSDSDETDSETDSSRSSSSRVEDAPQRLQPWRILSLTSPTTHKLSSGSNLAVDYIRLEDGPPTKLVVSVLVRNISFEKRVTVRYTSDGWKTAPSRECDANFSATVSATMGGVIGIDRFIATIDLEREAGFVGGEGNPASEELFIELAVRAELASSSFWDSNSGLNHRAHLKRMRRAPTPVNKSPSHKSRSKGRPASFAGVGSDLLGGTSVVRTDAAKAASAQALALANAAIAASEAARISREFEELRRSNSGLNVADTPSPPRRSQSFNGFGQLARAAAAADLPFSSPPVRQNRPGPASTTPQPSASSTEVRISITTPFSSVIMPAPDQPSESVPAPSSPALPGQSTQSAPQYPYAKPHSYHQPPHQPSHHHHHHQQPHPHQPNHLHPHFPHHHLPPSRSMSASRLNQKHLSLPLTPPSPGKTLQPILEAPLSSSTSSSVPANRSNSDKGSTGGVPGGARWLPQSHLRNSFVLDNNFDDASLAAAADLHRRRKRFSVEVMESSGPSSGDDGSLTLSPSPFSGGRYGSGAGAGSPATAAAGTASRLYGSSSDFEIPLSSWSSGVWGSSPPSAGW